MSNLKDKPRLAAPLNGNYLVMAVNPSTGETYAVPVSELSQNFLPDTVPPAIVAAVVLSPTVIRVTCSEFVPIASALGWSSKKNNVSNPLQSVSGIGTAVLDFTVQNAIASGDVVMISYNPAIGNSTDGAGNEFLGIVDQIVTNNL